MSKDMMVCLLAICACVLVGITAHAATSRNNPEAESTEQHHPNTFEDRYRRPIGDVLRDIAHRFNVQIKIEVDTAGVLLPYADSRIRPYSIEETLDNVLKPLDFRWERKGQRKFVVRYFDYPRRTFPDGEKLLAYLSTLYDDKPSWEARRDSLLPEVRERLRIDTALAARASNPFMRMSEPRVYDGYSVRNFALETLTGYYVCGSVYSPPDPGSHALIVCPNGHFTDGRYNAAQQQRMGTLARMGAVCVDYDLVGWGESEMQVGASAHTTARANTLQLLNGLCILDMMLENFDIDPSRIGVNGGSGGGTQTVFLAVLDPRFTAACPTVSMAAHFDGGCPCESGRAATLAGGGSCHPEIAACFAPKPMGLVSDSGDWTANTAEVELPYLKRIYGFYDAEDNITDVHLEGERHDFGPNKRQAVYDFFVRVFGLDASKIDEDKVVVEPRDDMMTFGSREAFPANTVSDIDELQGL